MTASGTALWWLVTLPLTTWMALTVKLAPDLAVRMLLSGMLEGVMVQFILEAVRDPVKPTGTASEYKPLESVVVANEEEEAETVIPERVPVPVTLPVIRTVWVIVGLL